MNANCIYLYNATQFIFKLLKRGNIPGQIAFAKHKNDFRHFFTPKKNNYPMTIF